MFLNSPHDLPSRPSSKRPLTFFASLIFLVATTTSAELLVVSNASGGTDDRGILLAVDSTTGLRTAVSDFGDPAQGPLGLDLREVCVKDGDLYVVDPGIDLLFRVDPNTGHREVVSDFSDPSQGPIGSFPLGLAIEPAGTLLVTDPEVKVLFRIDLETGQRTVLSDFTNTSQGPGSMPYFVRNSDGTGRILVSDLLGGRGTLLVVDPVDGERTVLADFNDGEPGQMELLATDPRLGIFVASFFANRVYRVDGVTGEYSAVVHFQDPKHGPPQDFRPTGMTVDAAGMLQVIGISVTFLGYDSAITVDPTTGNYSVLTSFAWDVEGPTAGFPVGIVGLGSPLMTDGFESGDLSGWSSSVGAI